MIGQNVSTAFLYLAAAGVGALALVGLAYWIGRAFGFGFYRSRLGYLRSFFKELHGGKNGES